MQKRGKVQSLQLCFNFSAFPVSFPAGQRCRHSGHPGGAATAVLWQHSQHEGEECEKVRVLWFSPLSWVSSVAVLSFGCCAAVQGIQQQFVMGIFSRATKIHVELRQLELMEPKTGHERFCWLTLLFLAIETKLGRVLNFTVEVFLIFFSGSSWKWLIKKNNKKNTTTEHVERNLKRIPGSVWIR